MDAADAELLFWRGGCENDLFWRENTQPRISSLSVMGAPRRPLPPTATGRRRSLAPCCPGEGPERSLLPYSSGGGGLVEFHSVFARDSTSQSPSNSSSKSAKRTEHDTSCPMLLCDGFPSLQLTV